MALAMTVAPAMPAAKAEGDNVETENVLKYSNHSWTRIVQNACELSIW